MIRYVLSRLALAVPLALGVATLVFLLMESAPGNATDQLLGDRPVPPEVRERIERAYGLDRSDIARIVRYAHEGAVATKLRVGNEEVDVLVKYPEWFRRDPANLERLKFRHRASGKLAIPLRSFATIGTVNRVGCIIEYTRLAVYDIQPIFAAVRCSGAEYSSEYLQVI